MKPPASFSVNLFLFPFLFLVILFVILLLSRFTQVLRFTASPIVIVAFSHEFGRSNSLFVTADFVRPSSNMSKSSGKSTHVDQVEQKMHETPLESESRKEANFAEIEAKLPKRYTRSEMSFIDKSTSK